MQNQKTVAPPPAISTVTPVEPTWIRLAPAKAGARCPYSSLSRAAMNLLVLNCKQNGFSAPVKSIHPKNIGRLVLWLGNGGLKEYLQNQLVA
jgi:hypothetical protein